MINDNLDKIYHFKGNNNGRKKHSKRSMFRAWNNLRAIRRRNWSFRKNSEQYCIIGKSKYPNRESNKLIFRKFEIKKNYQSNQRLSRNNQQSLGFLYYHNILISEYLTYIKSLTRNFILDNILLNEYYFKNIHAKGIIMEKITLDFSKIANDEDIEFNIESKIKGLIFILDSLEETSDQNTSHTYQSNGFYALKTLIYSLLTDVDELKINVEYMYQLLHKFKNTEIAEVA